ETPVATDHSAEEWARAILERAPISRRNARRFWRLIGLRLGPPGSPDHVQGWRIAARHDGWMRLEAASFYLTAQAAWLCEPGRVGRGAGAGRGGVRWAWRGGPARPRGRWAGAPPAGPQGRPVPVMRRRGGGVMPPP